jgi:hypothetical protein
VLTPHGTTDVSVSGIAVLAQQATAAILEWAITAAHSLAIHLTAIATVLELYLQRRHLLAQTQLITFMNVGCVVGVGQFRTVTAH